MSDAHTFFIPVMGTGFTIDTPLKVARYGIHSVVSLVDDTLIEEMRAHYCRVFGEPYVPIAREEEDSRARRITAYLDLLDRLVRRQFQALRDSAFEVGSEITRYFDFLPTTSSLRRLYDQMRETTDPRKKTSLQERLRELIRPGEIQVNIMTKLDRPAFAKNGTPLPAEFSDALAALRGYAKSRIESAIVFSAGLNQRLYNYVSEFKDFYADASGHIKKKIILKVSDFRSSLIQGKIFAKKGLWISEYRVESGLNCGGHAFATPGHLLGPILEEFKVRRKELVTTLAGLYTQAMKLKNRIVEVLPSCRLTVQGGIGTAHEDRFLRRHYGADATGWGSPFLLCPEVTNVDDETLRRLAEAGKKDLYLSRVSPLGVPFNNLRESLSDAEKERRARIGRPGSACPKGHLVSNTEFTPLPVCTASRLYQKLKLEHLAASTGDPQVLKEESRRVMEKACICHDLGQGARIRKEIPGRDRRFPAVCPGPNIAYFSKVVTLKEMIDHIYGRRSVLNATYRPHMFLNELEIYIDYLEDEVRSTPRPLRPKQRAAFAEFLRNLRNGIAYYRDLFPKMLHESSGYQGKSIEELDALERRLETMASAHPEAFAAALENVSG